MVKVEDPEVGQLSQLGTGSSAKVQSKSDDSVKPMKKRAGPSNPPPVWAETRQELAESLPYYRAYQSGSYTVGPYTKDSDLTQKVRRESSQRDSHFHKDFTPYAYLLGGHGSERDAWAHGGRVIVSHGGGHAAAPSSSKVKKEVDPDLPQPTGSTHLRLTSSQSRKDPRVAALIQSYATGTPCILILGENYPLSDFQLNCGFACLGWYIISACWAEKEQDDMVRWKVRFQWLEQQGAPWWSDGEGSSNPSRPLWNPRLRLEADQTKQRSSKTSGHSSVSLKRPNSDSTPTARLAERSKRRRIQSVCDQLSGPLDGGSVQQNCIQFKSDHWLRHTSCERKQECSSCHTTSPQVYSEGWSCLTPECIQGFWRFKTAERERSPLLESLSPTGLTFCKQFLEPYPREPTKSIPIPFPLEPSAHDAAGSSDGIRGLFCPQCHRLSCREYLAYHQCRHCGWIPGDTNTLRDSRLSSSQMDRATLSLLDDIYVNARFKISVNRRLEGPFEVVTLCLPEVFLDSKIHLIQHYTGARRDDCSRKQSAHDSEVDELLSNMQAAKDINLRRHELTMHRSCSNGSKSRLLTQMFTSNIGAAYKHSTATETISFEESPQCMLKAKEILQDRGKLVDANEEFNELYPCAYMSGMKMNYHDDGEPGLAPIVSSLSLGDVSARMNFRLKKKFVQDNVANLTTSSKNVLPPTILRAYKQHQKSAIQSALKIPAHDRVAVSLPLRHGTIVIQQGKALQECLEHAVLPNWDKNSSKDSQQSHSRGMRYAITARRID
ncbi:unnamed protein product [Sympodiomycopsis kandeliae]